MTDPGFLRLNRLRILCGGRVAYDQQFHNGVNIIRGQNSSGKSTIADFVFYVLGGEFEDWKDAARQCDEAQAEVATPRGRLTLKRHVARAQEPLSVYFGPMSAAGESSLEGWQRFPIRRQAGRESFSQVMFRSLLIPEAPSEGASNITMHQLLRVCYSDQRTPASRFFRFEPFDTQHIREAVGDLVCGINSYEAYEIGLELRELQKQHADIADQLSALHAALPLDQALDTPDLIRAHIRNLHEESVRLKQEVDDVDDLVERGEVREYLTRRRTVHASLIGERNDLTKKETVHKSLEFELREIDEFIDFLQQLKEKVKFAEATFEAVGAIEFTLCPACGEELRQDTPENHCVVCKSPVSADTEKERYNQIRLDLEIQTRESAHLSTQKRDQLEQGGVELRRLRREYAKKLAAFDLEYASGNGPREAFLATRNERFGRIGAEEDVLLKSLATAEQIATLTLESSSVAEKIESLRMRERALQENATARRPVARSLISDVGSGILRADLPRQPEFKRADNVTVDFRNDSITVGGLLNFAESSNVILKNAAVFALFLAAGVDPEFNHPRFLLIDNVEDKGMEEDRSHLFQSAIVERVSELKFPHQVIFTTSMMNPELDSTDYTIGPAYTSGSRSLALG